MTSARHLEESLRILRSEIGALGIDDEDARRRLESLVRDIETKIEHPEGVDPDTSLADGLKTSILSFEASHPRIAALMNDVVEKLSAMGI